MSTTEENSSKIAQTGDLKGYSTFSLYNVDEMMHHFAGLALATFTPAVDQELYSTHKLVPVENSIDQSSLSISRTMTCSICNTEFSNRNEQILHYKLDWHRFNIKLKLQGGKPVPERQFDEVAGDISSLSGSDSSSDDERSDYDTNGSDSYGNAHHKKPSVLPSHVKVQTRRRRLSSATSTDTEAEDSESVEKNTISHSRLQPKLYFKNQIGKIIALYRCVVHGKGNAPKNELELLGRVTALPNQMNWAIILVGGGHFAAAVYNQSEIKLHKTFHRYTVRAKQGCSQGTRDAKHGGSQPKSAGASLRRHNEAALIKDIQDQLGSWNAELQKCSCIFYRAPSFNRVALFGGKNPPFKKDDPRLRNIPFPTRRATFNEVQRVFRLLSTLECFGERPDDDKTIPQSPKVHLGIKRTKKSPCTSSPEKGSEMNYEMKPSNYKERTKKHIRKAKQENPVTAKESKDQSDNFVSSYTSDSDDSIKFEVVDEQIMMADLKETDGTQKRKQHKRKGKHRSGSISKRQQDPSIEVLCDEKCNIKNALFLACRSGDLEALRKLLDILKRNPHLDKPDPNIIITKTEDNDVKKDMKSNQILTEHGKPSILQNLKDSDHYQQSKEKLSESSDIGNTVSDDHDTGQSGKLTNDCESSLEEIKFVLHLQSEFEVPIKEGANNKIQQKCNKNSDKDFNADTLTLKILNDVISDSGATVLHIATKEGHQQAVRMLLEYGADPTARDKRGLTPYMTSNNREMRNEYRRFMAENPDRFDYNKAQVPSPLTEEMQREKIERRKEKKKFKKEKLKEKKAAEMQRKLEEDEKKRFLSLSDREKRALAAEKRYVKQLSAIGESSPVLSRCFQCGENITGKVPFEYNNYCFCSVNCVKAHRKDKSHFS